ncbi:unnamed protein product, partial [Closterium sp. NIES-54]
MLFLPSLPPVRPSQVYVPLSPPHWSIDFSALSAALTPIDLLLLSCLPFFPRPFPPLPIPSLVHSLPCPSLLPVRPSQVYVPLSPPHWSIDFSALSAALTPRTKGIILNSPCNPTGRVFSHAELSQIAQVCCHHDLLAITDEVYSAFTYGSGSTPRHVSLAQWPGMKERCIVTSSISKTFHVTGWRVGWAIAPAPIAAAISTISAKLIDTPPAPFQEASRAALSLPSSYYTQLREDYTHKRDTAVAMLLEAGLEVPLVPEGSVFVFASIPERWGVDD